MDMRKEQQKVSQLYKDNNWDTKPELLIIAMQEELGELSSRFLAEHPGYEKDINKTHPIPEEVGDLLTLILAFCNKMGIDASASIENTITKRKKKT